MTDKFDLLRQFVIASARLADQIEAVAKDKGLKLHCSTYLILCDLYDYDAPKQVTMIDIGFRSNSYNLGKLAENGYITLESSEADRRAKICTLTSSGREAVEVMREDLKQTQAELERVLRTDLQGFQSGILEFCRT